MSSLKLMIMGLFLSAGFSVVSAASAGSVAEAKPSHKMHKEGRNTDKGPCAEIECERGDKFCRSKKNECKSKMFQKKLEEAKKNGISAEEKSKWVARMESKISRKRERVVESQDRLKDYEARLKQIQELKTK